MIETDISIKWPFKWVLVGSSGSGKTNFALQIVKNHQRLFDQSPTRVIVIYKVFQNIYNSFKDILPTSLYTEDDVDIDKLTEDNQDRLLFVCDDLYFSSKLNEIAEQFLIKGRHQNTSWIVLTQSIFNQPALKNISRNSTHLTLFKNIRLSEPHTLFSQLRPKNSKVLQEIYSSATKLPFGYLDIDLSQTCPDNVRYKTDIFSSVVTVFCIMNNSSFKTMYLVDKKDLLSKLGKENREGENQDNISSNIAEEADQNQNIVSNPHSKDITSKNSVTELSPTLKTNFNRKEYEDENNKSISGENEELNSNVSPPTIQLQKKEDISDKWLSSENIPSDSRKRNIAKSLIKPADFEFLKSKGFPKYLGKWKPLNKKLKKKFLKSKFRQW